jgi:hypothetical protein
MKEVNWEREEKKLPPIKHCFDGWHFQKSVLKDIWKAAKLKKCIALSCWIKSIKNQIWHSIGNCGGNPDMLIEMILSIPEHVAGNHSFPNNQFFKACNHGPLEGVRDEPWLKIGSLAYKKLVLALRGYKDSRLKDLNHMTENLHTSKNEQLNNVHNMYLPKHTFFGPQQARVRACLAVIDHNFNINRPAKKDVDGDIRYTWKVTRRVSSKQTKINFGSNRNKPKQDLFRVCFGLFRETKHKIFRFVSVFRTYIETTETNRTVS